MPATRIVLVLCGTVAVLLTVVVLRVETARLHRQIVAVERQIDEQHEACRRSELVLARLRNPMAIRARIEELDRQSVDAPATRTPPAAPKKAATPKPTRRSRR